MKLASVFAILFFLFAEFASADGLFGKSRKFGLFGGGGLDKVSGGASYQGTQSKFEGWGLAGEAGMDIPFEKEYGIQLSAELGKTEVLNRISASVYEDISIHYVGAKLGIFFSAITVGGGYRMNQLALKSVPSSAGGLIEEKGTSMFGFGSLSLNSGLFRAAVEGQYESGKFGSVDYTDFSVGLRFYFVVDGK